MRKLTKHVDSVSHPNYRGPQVILQLAHVWSAVLMEIAGLGEPLRPSLCFVAAVFVYRQVALAPIM